MNSKAELDAADEGGEPVLDMNYPPWLEPLYWEEFKAWAAVKDEQVADPVTAAALQCYRAGRTAARYGHPVGTEGLVDFHAWAATNLHIRSKDPRGKEIAEHGFLAGSLRH